MTQLLILGVIGGVTGGTAGMLLHRLLERRRRHAFRYVCPQPRCPFEVAGSDPAVVDMLATAHEQRGLHHE